jgi:hypothetical protein
MNGSLQMAGDDKGLQPAASPHGNSRQAAAVGPAAALASRDVPGWLSLAAWADDRLRDRVADFTLTVDDQRGASTERERAGSGSTGHDLDVVDLLNELGDDLPLQRTVRLDAVQWMDRLRLDVDLGREAELGAEGLRLAPEPLVELLLALTIRFVLVGREISPKPSKWDSTLIWVSSAKFTC